MPVPRVPVPRGPDCTLRPPKAAKKCYFRRRRHWNFRKWGFGPKNCPFGKKGQTFAKIERKEHFWLKFSQFLETPEIFGSFRKNLLDEAPHRSKNATKCNKNENFGGWWNPTKGQAPKTSDHYIYFISIAYPWIPFLSKAGRMFGSMPLVNVWTPSTITSFLC